MGVVALCASLGSGSMFDRGHGEWSAPRVPHSLPARATPQARWMVCALVFLAALAILPYVRAVSLPLISDDYDQINKGRLYGPVSGWLALLGDPLYRCRATSLLVTHWTERLFGIQPLAFNLSSLLMHVFNTWLVFALGVWPRIGWRVAAVAAAFFAIYHGHQEAVTWYAALPELVVFFFTVSGLICWICWLRRPAVSSLCYLATLACFLLALASKESAVALVPALFLALYAQREDWRRRLVTLVPFAGLAFAYFVLVYASRAEHLFFHDGTFSLEAPFLIVLARSSARLFWIWGLASLVLIIVSGAERWRRVLLVALAWVVIGLLPYSFLTYMPQVPSRHTYLASVGLSLVVAAGFHGLAGKVWQLRPWLVWFLAGVMLIHNCGYVWTKKHAQMLKRAAPTEELVELASRTHEGIYLECFPYSPEIAVLAVEMRTLRPPGTVAWGPAGQKPENHYVHFCWAETP